MSVAASRTLLRGMMGMDFEPGLASPIRFIFQIGFELMPALIEDGLIEARFGFGPIFKPPALVILPGPGMARHLLCLQVFQDEDSCLLLIDKCTTRLVTKVRSYVAKLFMPVR